MSKAAISEGEGKPKKKDGRALRAERSRRAVAQAGLDLIREGTLRPTAAAVAERAGVSLRLVFHHYKDMDAVLRHSIALQATVVAPLIPIPFDAEASLGERLDLFVARRAKLYEVLTPVRLAALRAEHDSERIAEEVGRFRSIKRKQIEHVFAKECEGLDEGRLCAAKAAASWATWYALRHHQGLDVDATKVAFRAGLEALLG